MPKKAGESDKKGEHTGEAIERHTKKSVDKEGCSNKKAAEKTSDYKKGHNRGQKKGGGGWGGKKQRMEKN